MDKERGFTLIELVVVIVILGVLAAIAVPKFLSMATEARIAALNSMAGTLASTASTFRLSCATSTECKPVGLTNLVFNGQRRWAWYGRPIESTRGTYWWSIEQLVDYSGFTYSSGTATPTGGTSSITAFFDRTDAPTPSTCRVMYQYFDADKAPVITVLTSGC